MCAMVRPFPDADMDNPAVLYCRLLDARAVAGLLDIPAAKEGGKHACPNCGSSDALHVYKGPGQGSHCFSCEKSPDAIDLVRLVAGMEFFEAVGWLARQFGFSDLLDNGSRGADHAKAKARRRRIANKMREKREEKARIEKAQKAVARSVFTDLWAKMRLGPSGCKYLEGRGVPREVADHFGISSVESKEEWREIRSSVWPPDLEDAGLVGRGDNGPYPLPWRAPFLVIPYAHGGQIDLLRFRDLSGGNQKYLSPIGHRPTAPYQSENAYKFADTHDTLFVCEGEINALSVIYAGAPAVGSCGNGVWESAWSRPFRWYRNVMILCDGDEAGIRFSQKVKKQTQKVLGADWVNKRLRRRKFVDGMDANDALQEGQLKRLVHAVQ